MVNSFAYPIQTPAKVRDRETSVQTKHIWSPFRISFIGDIVSQLDGIDNGFTLYNDFIMRRSLFVTHCESRNSI